MRLRCFVAVDVEDLNIVRKLTDVQRELASVGTRLKLVEPENLHLTLAFIGEVPPPIVEAARRALGEVSLRRFKIRLVGIGAFPTINRPRVVWVGVSEGREELQVLAREVRASLKRHGVPFDKKEFVPHLTIARVKGRGEGLARILRGMAGSEIGELMVDRVRLKKSTLTPRGPIYETLYEKELE